MILGYILAVLIDTHSTCLALNNGRREILLPFKTCSSIITYNVISTTSIIIYDKKFLKRRDKLRKFILITGIIAHSSAAIYNYRNIKK